MLSVSLLMLFKINLKICELYLVISCLFIHQEGTLRALHKCINNVIYSACRLHSLYLLHGPITCFFFFQLVFLKKQPLKFV